MPFDNNPEIAPVTSDLVDTEPRRRPVGDRPTEDTLSGLRIARPCNSAWDLMKGDDRVRHCSNCKLNVYNVSGMPTSDAIELIRRKEGRLCMRLLRRKDGTILTADCKGGRSAKRNSGLVAMLLFGAATALGLGV
jgi:hypothetical protein